MHRSPTALFVSLALAVAAPAAAADFADPDWPCVQRKVPELAIYQMWSGALPEGEAADPDAVAELARRISQRRVSIEAATELASSYVAGVEGEDRARELGFIFEAVLAGINRERATVIAGIGRYARSQAELSERVEQEQLELARLESTPDADAARIDELRQTVAWSARIFRERAQSLTYVCETPVLLERRAFELGRALAGLV